jgi:hypothetical protein
MKIYIICALLAIIFVMVAVRRCNAGRYSILDALVDNHICEPIIKLPFLVLAILNMAHIINISWGWFVIGFLA